MNKLNFLGAGPKIAMVLLPWLVASIILFIIPALSLLLDSWLVLTSAFIGYFLFRMFIKTEYYEMEKFFGEEYLKYRKGTPEFFPFPKKKSVKHLV